MHWNTTDQRMLTSLACSNLPRGFSSLGGTSHFSTLAGVGAGGAFSGSPTRRTQAEVCRRGARGRLQRPWASRLSREYRSRSQLVKGRRWARGGGAQGGGAPGGVWGVMLRRDMGRLRRTRNVDTWDVGRCLAVENRGMALGPGATLEGHHIWRPCEGEP